MVSQTLTKQLYEQLDRLSIEEQRQVLDFARALAVTRIHGVPGQTLLRFGGAIDADDLAAIEKAIEEGCERIDRDEW